MYQVSSGGISTTIIFLLQPTAVAVSQKLASEIEIVRAQNHCDVVNPIAVRVRVARCRAQFLEIWIGLKQLSNGESR